MDSLSIAWAVIESLIKVNKYRSLFATYYHELTKLLIKAIRYLTMRTQEWDNKIIFFTKLQKVQLTNLMVSM